MIEKVRDFPIVCNDGTCEILNPQPIYYADKKELLKDLDFILLQFTTESKETCCKVLDAYQDSLNIAQTNFTRGSYQRRIL